VLWVAGWVVLALDTQHGKRPVLAVTSRGLGSLCGSGKSALMEKVCALASGFVFCFVFDF